MMLVFMMIVMLGVSTGTPVEHMQGDEVLNLSMQEMVETLKELIVADTTIQKQLLTTMQTIVSSQESIQRFFGGANEVDLTRLDPTNETQEATRVESIRFFTNHVVAAINSGNNTQLDEVIAQLKSLNTAFRGFFAKQDCPDPFVPLGDECFNFQLEDLSWEESRQRCHSLGAELAEPKNLTEVRLYIFQNFPRKSRRNFWIGAINNNKVWEWLSGNPVQPGFWYTNEPSGNGECLAMFDGWEHPLTDFPCENPRRAVCEKKLT